LVNEILPAAIKSHLFGVILDSCASEHAARANAMQAASENAGQIIEELRMQYNRVRQEVITSEILDIIGGAEAIHKGR
jgi:F-type H+-transporting ATPase subunit gamma